MLVYGQNKKQVYIFPQFQKNLPIHGWFQCCCICDIITNKTQIYSQNNNMTVYYYICSPCTQKQLSKEIADSLNLWLLSYCNKYQLLFLRLLVNILY